MSLIPEWSCPVSAPAQLHAQPWRHADLGLKLQLWVAGVDVAGLLQRVGLEVTTTSEQVGTFAIAYAAHKALSPVRFPPTVALTPVVAKWLKKDDSKPSAK